MDVFWRACTLAIIALVVAIVLAATGYTPASIAAFGFGGIAVLVAVVTV